MGGRLLRSACYYGALVPPLLVHGICRPGTSRRLQNPLSQKGRLAELNTRLSNMFLILADCGASTLRIHHCDHLRGFQRHPGPG
jgi:hypothetical protein